MPPLQMSQSSGWRLSPSRTAAAVLKGLRRSPMLGSRSQAGCQVSVLEVLVVVSMWLALGKSGRGRECWCLKISEGGSTAGLSWSEENIAIYRIRQQRAKHLKHNHMTKKERQHAHEPCSKPQERIPSASKTPEEKTNSHNSQSRAERKDIDSGADKEAGGKAIQPRILNKNLALGATIEAAAV